MTKYRNRTRLCCTLNRTCFVANHLIPFVKKHPTLVAKVISHSNKGMEYDEWVNGSLSSPSFVAGWLYGMLASR